MGQSVNLSNFENLKDCAQLSVMLFCSLNQQGLQRLTRELNQETYCLGKNGFEIIHEYKYLGSDFYSNGYFEQSSNS